MYANSRFVFFVLFLSSLFLKSSTARNSFFGSLYQLRAKCSLHVGVGPEY